MSRAILLAVVLLLIGALSEACQSHTDQRLRALIASHNLTGDPSQGRDLPSIDEPLAQLGMELFFSQTLSGDYDTACASCHHPLLGGGDALPLSIGAGAIDPALLGPGRSHSQGAWSARNAPTTFNAAMWDQVMFWDGRVESLGKSAGRNGADGAGIRTPDSGFGEADPQAGENLAAAQSRFPLITRTEMRGITHELGHNRRNIRTRLSARLASNERWQEAFATAFGEEEAAVSEQKMAAALGAYERSQVFVDTPWKRYIEGDENAISDAAKRGALLFFTSSAEDGAGCATCHRGDFFSDEGFHILALPQIGWGAGDGLAGGSGYLRDDDYGRFRESADPDDKYAFRTPTLLNVEVTGPYGHDGAYSTLTDIVRHHLDPAAGIASYDISELPSELWTIYNSAQLSSGIWTHHWRENSQEALEEQQRLKRAGALVSEAALTEAEIDDVVAFLHALTDPCAKSVECLAPWIPSGEEIDGSRLEAEFLEIR